MSEPVPTALALRRIGFIGLGVMGYPIAGHLARAGHAITVYNRTPGKSRQWVEEFGGQVAGTPGQAARDADLVLVCVGNDADLRSVILGDQGAFAAMSSGSILIDHLCELSGAARPAPRHGAGVG